MTVTELPDIDSLDDRVVGPVLTGGDPAVTTEVATFNLAVTHRPHIVVGAACSEDVAEAVRWAGINRLPVAVQATGHGPVHAVTDGLLITTHRMRRVLIDPDRRLARVEAGARWSDVISAAAVHGLAPLSGSSSHVGVVGYTLGGGIGPLARQFGFAADVVTRVTMVTADGSQRIVDAESDPDLFWAVRGGKGNFGVVTELEFGLVPVATLYAGGVFFAAESAADVLHAYREWAPALPESTTTSIAILRMPDAPVLPERLRGRTVVHLRYAHNGPEAEGALLLAPMLSSGIVVLETVGRMSVTGLDSVHQDPTEPLPAWERGVVLTDLPDAAVDELLASAGPDADTCLLMVELRQLGGAMGRQPAVPNAVAGREGRYSLLALGVLAADIADRVPREGTALVQRMAPWCTGTSLLNFLGDADSERVAAAWPPEIHRRLLAVKKRVDPDNMFRFGHALTD
jgi:FAD/FMN-containing dehydrogenase